jgi:hypothetical protein
LASAPPEIKRGRGRPPGSGAAPKPLDKPATPAPAPATPAGEDDFDWDSLTNEEAADVIASGINIGLKAFNMRALDDPDVLPLRKHAKPVVRRWAGTFFKKYMHEIMIVAAVWGPVMERIEERKRAAAQPEPPPAPKPPEDKSAA